MPADPYLSWTPEGRLAWRRAIDALRSTKYPQRVTEEGKAVPVRVTVRRIRMDPENYGECRLLEKPGRFCIEINRALSPVAAMDTLAHEWAHALTWVRTHLDEHHPGFWLAVGECSEIIWEQR